MVADVAVKAGATLWPATEAVEPLVEDGFVRGAIVKRKETGVTEAVRARYVLVADGANSRFGRALGAARDRTYPLGMAVRGYFTSPLHDDPWIESHLDIRDKHGNHLPGYGWIFPVGDGTVNVGVGSALHLLGLEGREHLAPHGGVLRHRARAVGPLRRLAVRPAHRRQAADRVLGEAERRSRTGSPPATRSDR